MLAQAPTEQHGAPPSSLDPEVSLRIQPGGGDQGTQGEVRGQRSWCRVLQRGEVLVPCLLQISCMLEALSPLATMLGRQELRGEPGTLLLSIESADITQGLWGHKGESASPADPASHKLGLWRRGSHCAAGMSLEVSGQAGCSGQHPMPIVQNPTRRLLWWKRQLLSQEPKDHSLAATQPLCHHGGHPDLAPLSPREPLTFVPLLNPPMGDGSRCS